MRLLLLLAAMGIAGGTWAGGQTGEGDPGQAGVLCGEIGALTKGSAAHWGVSVTTLDGTVVCQSDAAKLFRPASNTKLLTAAAALATLGPEYRFETRVTGLLNAKTGIVQGDLTLLGGGDANLDSEDLPYEAARRGTAKVGFALRDLDELARQLAARGVKRVEGDVVGDDRLFPYDPWAATWEVEDLVSSDGAPVSALTLADNQVRLRVTPASAGLPAMVALDQHGVPYYRVEAEVTTVPAKGLTGVQVERLPGSRVLRVYGTIAAGSQPFEDDLAMEDPAAFAAMAFHRALQSHGIAVRGRDRAEHRPVTDGADFQTQVRQPGANAEENEEAAAANARTGCDPVLPQPVLATHVSGRLAEDVVYTDKVSQNLHAELLLRALAGPCAPQSRAAGVRRVRDFLLRAGLADGDFVLYDGSGLSSHDLVTPRALTQLLVYAASQPWFAAFKAALPVGGVDGSLAARFSGDLKGRVFAKTGSLGESRALSGYVTAGSGRTMVFSILEDDHLPGMTEDRKLMDRMVERIAGTN